MGKSVKEIVQDGAPVLREVAQPLPERLFGSAELTKLLADMAEVLDKEPEGVALAAPQLGVSWRLFIIRIDRTINKEHPTNSKAELQVYINPEIMKTSRKRARADEGCLSARGVYGVMSRHERITIRARREDGTMFMRGAGGLMAQIFEHEIDHLNGVLFTDHAEHLIQTRHNNDE